MTCCLLFASCNGVRPAKMQLLGKTVSYRYCAPSESDSPVKASKIQAWLLTKNEWFWIHQIACNTSHKFILIDERPWNAIDQTNELNQWSSLVKWQDICQLSIPPYKQTKDFNYRNWRKPLSNELESEMRTGSYSYRTNSGCVYNYLIYLRFVFLLVLKGQSSPIKKNFQKMWSCTFTISLTHNDST